MWRASAPRFLVAVSAAAMLAAPATLAHAQQPAAVVERAGADSITVATGARGSIAFHIRNPGTTNLGVSAVVNAPAGWRVVAPEAELEIPARGSSLRVVTFYPAADAVGRYPLELELRTRTGAVAADLVHVIVPPRRKLEMEVQAAPAWATAGARYVVLVRVTNTGNVSGRYAVSIDSPYGIEAVAYTDSIRLDPGASQTVQVEVMPPAEMRRAVIHSLKIRALGDTVAAEVVAPVEIVPGPRGGREPRVGVPGEIRFRASQDPRAGPPLRFEAAGPVRPGSDTRVTAVLQGPTQAYSMFGDADLYRFGLHSPRFSLNLGDNTFRLSRLTEPGRQGLGIGGSARLGAFAAGGFVHRDRRSLSPDTQYAAFASVSPIRHVNLRGNWLRTDSEAGRTDVLSSEASVRVPGWLSLRGEFGVRPATGATASSGELSARRGPFTLSVLHLEADTAYGGVQRGLSTRSAHLNVQPWRAFYLEGSVQDQATERAFDSFIFRSTQRSARVAAGWGSLVSLEAHALDRVTGSAQPVTERSARSVRLRLGLPIGPLTLYPAFETGVGAEGADAETLPFWRGGARAALRAGPATISSNLEYFTGGTLHRSLNEEGLAGTATAALRFGSTHIRVSTHGTRYIAPLSRENLVIDAVLEHRLRFGHRISARVLRRVSDGLLQHDETIALLDYSIPLKLPTGGRGQTGTVTGRVHEATTGAPLSNVIVDIGGRRVATDRNGRLRVSGLEPGVHYVDIDRSTTAAAGVPSVPMPMRIELKAGERRNFDVALLPAGALTVRTTIVRATSASGRAEHTEPVALQRVAVDLIHGDQRIRRHSDGRGLIEVGGLRPGLWTVRVARADLPAFHRFDRDSVAIEVTGGSHSEVVFAAAPVRRRVEIVATADLVEQPAAAAAAPARSPVGRSTPARAAEPITPDRPRTRPTAPRVLGTPAEPLGTGAAAPRAQPTRRNVDAHILGTPAAKPTPQPHAARPASTPQPADSIASPRGFTMSVVGGDRSLRSIAGMVYGDRDLWPRIWLANRDLVSDPDRLYPGQVLRIPPGGPLTEEERSILRRYPEDGS